jgi:hypothetical protein
MTALIRALTETSDIGENIMLANSYIGVENAKPEIIALVKKTAESQFKIGEILKGLKAKVETFKKDDFKKKDSPYQVAKMEYDNLVENELPFGKVVANKLVLIASDKGIKKYLDKIPFAYNTMYDLTGMSTQQWNFYFKNGLDGKSTAKDIKEMKKKWLEKTQPKVNEEPTEQEVQETQQQVKDLTGKKELVISEEYATAIAKSFVEPSVSVKVFESNISTEQYTSLAQILKEVIGEFFTTEKLEGKFEVAVNPDILSDTQILAKAA